MNLVHGRSVRRCRGVSPRVILDLCPRGVLLLLRLLAVRAVLGDLEQPDMPKDESASEKETTGRDTYVAVLLAPVARLDGGLCAVHVLRDGVRRRQTVPIARTPNQPHTTWTCRAGGRGVCGE